MLWGSTIRPDLVEDEDDDADAVEDDEDDADVAEVGRVTDR